MSTTTVSVWSSSVETTLAEVRRREAQAREAAQRAAERAVREAEAKRRREEKAKELETTRLKEAQARELEAARRREEEARQALRRRQEAAHQAIQKQDALFQTVQMRLDTARQRLPDLELSVPVLPILGSEATGDVTQLEAHASAVTAFVARFSQDVEAAIAAAERLLADRLARASAWREAGDLERQAAAVTQSCTELAARLAVANLTVALPEKPDGEADLATVQAYVAAMRNTVAALRADLGRLHSREESRKRAGDLSGPKVTARESFHALAQRDAAQAAAAKGRLLDVLNAALAAANLNLGEVSEATRLLVLDALECAGDQDRSEQVRRWIAREQQHQEGVKLALAMMESAPATATNDAAITRRWRGLLARLQEVAGGLEEFTPNLAREYEQIQSDVRRSLAASLSKADWVRAMSEQGFEVIEPEAGGLLIVDLDSPDVWLEATEVESEGGGFGAVLELKTDREASHDAADEVRITAAVCSKLGKVADAAAKDVQPHAEVVERATRIKRGRRPAKPKALSSALG